MSSGELLLIFLVALLVFGPNKLPMLANHLGQLMRKLNQWQQNLSQLWENHLKQQQLEDNTKKAEQADKIYKD